MDAIGFILASIGLSIAEELLPECPEKEMIRYGGYGCLIVGLMITTKSVIIAIKNSK